MANLMSNITNTADAFTQNFKDRYHFDYSVQSLSAMDDLLEEMRDYELDEDAIYSISTMAGCYIFETARRNYGGKYFWLPDEEQPMLVAGEPDFSVKIKVWEKVRGRLENGPEDNIPFYIAGYREHIEKGMTQKGYNVTIV